jgi:carbonic anhydrase
MNQTVRELLAGNADHAGAYDGAFDHVQAGQRPDAVTVCCSDSRVLQDHMWGNDEPGKVFTCGNIGNRVVQETGEGQVVSGDVLYPIEHTGTRTAVVVGHTGCGAVTATFKDLTEGLSEPAGITHCIETLKPHLRDGVDLVPDGLSEATAINHLVEYNVDSQVDFLRESDDTPEDLTVVGAVYDFQDVYSGKRGQVHVVNVDGERNVETLKAAHPDISHRVERRWDY